MYVYYRLDSDGGWSIWIDDQFPMNNWGKQWATNESAWLVPNG